MSESEDFTRQSGSISYISWEEWVRARNGMVHVICTARTQGTR